MQAVLRAPHLSTADEQRRQVQQALLPQEMAAHFTRVFGSPHADAGDGPACRVLNMKLEAGEYCTILYQFGEGMVIGAFRWAKPADDLPATARLITPLGMYAYRFDQDPALPGLATTLDGQAMREVLNETLPECRDGHARVLRCRATPLRYRPDRRCTLRFDVALRDTRTGAFNRRRLFGKVYHDLAKATSVHGEMQMLADSAPARDGRVVLAPIVAFLPDLRLILQGPVEGTPLELYLEGLRGRVTAGDQRGWDGIIRSASAFAAVHTAGLSTDRERPIEKELKRFVKRAAQAAEVDPVVGGRMGDLAAALPNWLDRLPGWDAEIGLVHGDCKHSQCMVTPQGIAILDFDHCGMADPATDIGTYLATLRQLGIHQAIGASDPAAAATRKSWLRELEERFLDEYCAASGYSPGFRPRATWYEAVALMRKALRGFARSPRSPMPLAQVEEGWRCLEALPAS